MKDYYCYSESSYKGDFPKYYKKFKYSEKDTGRISIAYYSFCFKQNMINVIGTIPGHSKNWVKERVGRMGNAMAMELCDANPGCIIVVENRSKDVMEIINIKDSK